MSLALMYYASAHTVLSLFLQRAYKAKGTLGVALLTLAGVHQEYIWPIIS